MSEPRSLIDGSASLVDEARLAFAESGGAAKVSLFAAVAISFVTIGVASLYALPNGDDFCRSAMEPLVASVSDWRKAPSVFGYVRDSWSFWTGRWASVWIETAVLSAINITKFYYIALLSVWLMILFGLGLIVREVLPRSFDRRDAFFGTLLLFAIFWLNMPEPGEALFWFTGAVENILPVSTGGAVIALLARSARSSVGIRKIQQLIAALGAFLVPGLHELFGGLLIVALAIGSIFIGTHDRSRAVPWIICTILATISEAIVFAAPGNAVRAGYYAPPSAPHAMKVTAWQLLNYIPDWTLSGALLLATILLVTFRTTRDADLTWIDEHFPGRRVALIPALVIAMVVVSIFGSTYVLSAPLAGRTVSGLYLVFLIGWFLSVIAIAPRVKGKDAKESKLVFSLCAFALGAALILQGNTRAGLLDLKDRVGAWHASMSSRFDAIESAQDTSELVLVPPAPPPPTIFFWRDIQPDPSDFRNVCVARFFRVGGVAIQTAGPR